MHEEFRTEQFAESFVGVWKRVVTDPRGFFQDMPTRGGIQAPLLFLMGCLVVAALGYLVLGPRGFGLSLVFWGMLRSFLYAAVFLLVARQIFSGSADFEATYRVIAYATAPMAFMFLPLVGGLTFLYTLFLVIVGLERVNGFDAVKSVLTVLLAGLVIVTLGWALGLHGHASYHHGVPSHGLPGCHR
ncbi:MAG: YIP1 family protein [Deltaproteobacteria bacterium]|nr:YIP1 family protein [Deltaproteobacteria bacterium]